MKKSAKILLPVMVLCLMFSTAFAASLFSIKNQTANTDPTATPTPEPPKVVVPIEQMASAIPWLPLDEKAIPTTMFIGFSLSKPPFDQVLVRKAFSLAIDRERISDGSISRGNTTTVPATTIIPPQTLGVDLLNIVGLKYDKEAAKQALIDAGYTDASKLPEVEIVFYEGSTDLVKAYVEMWKDALGVDVKMMPVKSGEELYKTIDENKTGLFILGSWIADMNDPNNFTKDTFLNPQSHYQGLTETKFAELILEAEEKADDPAARQALYIEAEKLLCETEVYIIPVTHSLYEKK